MDMPEKVIQWHRLSARVFVEGSDRRLMHEQAADTIERLQKERDQLGAGVKVWQRTAGHLKQERDAALAEVETAAAIENTMGMEITRLQGEVERLQKENKLLQSDAGIRDYVELCGKLSDDQGSLIADLYSQIGTLTGKRDTALAEVERLRAEVDLLREQSAQRAEDQAIYDAGISDGLTRSRRDWS